nr:ATP-binding protein [Collimonas arenae]
MHFTDTGAGIPQEALPNIFDGFFTTKNSGGTGVGLTFCHRVMVSFGGRIRCDSVAGQYTTFTLEFPRVDNLAQDLAPVAASRQAEKSTAIPPPLGS